VTRRFDAAAARLDVSRQKHLSAWCDGVASSAPWPRRPGNPEDWARIVLAEAHLGVEAFAEVLDAIADAAARGAPWMVAFSATAPRCRLKGDECLPVVGVLDRVVRRDHLPPSLDVPSLLVGAAIRLCRTSGVPDDVRRWWLAAGAGEGLAWATCVGVDFDGAPRHAREARLSLEHPQWYWLRAAEVRDMLGLWHYGRGADLVMLTYRRPRAPLRYPTIADAGPGAVAFAPAAETDPCGVTRHLRTGERCMPEVVHENLVAGDLLLVVYPLGQVR
jgi:hypothetical protein